MQILYWIHLPEHTDPKTQGYIGVTNNFTRRKQDHIYCAKNNKHRNSYLQRVILKYESVLCWDILFTGTTEGCYQLEEYFRSIEKIGWNLAAGGEIPALGRIVTDETKAKLSAAAKRKGTPTHLHTKTVRDKIVQTRLKNERGGTKVICNETKQIFNTTTSAGKHFEVSHSAISACCRGKCRTIKGHTFSYI